MAFYREINLLYLIQWLKKFTASPKGKSRVNCKSLFCLFFVIFRIGCRETSEVFKDHSSSLLILSFFAEKKMKFKTWAPVIFQACCDRV